MNNPSAAPSPEILALSHRFGGDPAFVLAGGGNTSSKTPDVLWVKASGHALATIGTDGFVALDRAKLQAMLAAADWPLDPREREALFLRRVMEARVAPERGQRPSVEALLHHLMPDALVVHTHPGLVNAVTCCVDGERLTREWFGEGVVLWQPYVDPGLVLARALADALTRAPRRPIAVFLENHGLIVGGETPEQIVATSERIVGRIAQALGERGEPAAEDRSLDDDVRHATAAAALVAERPGLHVVGDASPECAWLAGTEAGRAAAMAGPLTPDQIVYCRSFPLWLARDADRHAVADAWAAYVATYGVEPWVAVVEGTGVIAMRESAAMAETTRAVYADAAAVAHRAHQLGGVRALSPAGRRFIEEWEVEAFRRSVAARASAGK